MSGTIENGGLTERRVESKVASETEAPAPEVVVEVIDDVPEGDRGRRVAPETSPEGDSDLATPGEEIDTYSRRVQKRIAKLTETAAAERRAKETILREREEAVAHAARVNQQLAELRQRQQQAEQVLMEQAKARTEAQIAQARRAARDALETGDPDAIVDAQSALRRLEAEHDRIAAYRPPAPEQRQDPPPPSPQQRVEIPEPDALAKGWADKNPWFGSNKRMTATAYGVHEELIAEGVDPSSADYYQRIDQAMREVYPKAFETETDRPARQANPTPQSVVAPATRSVASPRTVKLTASQVSLARRLNLTNEQYAAQLIKDGLNG